MSVDRVLPNIVTDRVSETRDFYVDLLGFTVNFAADWYVQISAPGDVRREIGIWRRDHELIPDEAGGPPGGVILTVVVDDVDAVHERAVGMGVPVLAPPRDLFYGQRSCLVRDPNGLVVDVSTPVGDDLPK
ncbi:VOC family protein [Spongiactinospora sp. TRM90649]|uniref:VOC family protein n=1 Tax=Spongiactinospora sp. TRM90649 TaxID=3031114 RepID=UPI0023F81132|nr:VOC family protein [Spongiactinospora sp. TRM90649]MDF5757203.1 VOC family protein [Spongiactinospora sp. TRM90649]